MADPIVEKKPYQSKTLWVALVVALVAFFPGAKDFIAKNPEAVTTGLGLIFAALRLVTKGKVSIE